MIEKKPTLFGISSANLLNPKTIHHLLLPDLHKKTLQIALDSGYDGIELFGIKRQNLYCVNSNQILSLHQSFQRFRFSHVFSSYLLARAIFLPHQYNDFNLLEETSRNLWGKPTVLYHDAPASNAFTQREIQIQPHVFEAWGVGSMQDFIEVAKQKGFDGICFDTTHSLVSSNKWNLGTLPNMLETIINNNFLSSIHASFSREDHIDITGKEQTLWMREMLLNGRNSELATVLNMAYLAGVERIIVEIIPSVIWEFLGRKNLFLGQLEMIEIHKRIRANLDDKCNS